MAKAVEYELRAHHFSAGRYTLGLQICDDSGTNGCTTNPKAYAATPAVIGVIGPNYSGCAGPEIPVLSRAGLAMVAPTPNDPWLTGGTRVHALPDRDPQLCSTVVRNDQEGVAAAHLARRLGVHRVYVYLEDPKGVPGPHGPALRPHRPTAWHPRDRTGLARRGLPPSGTKPEGPGRRRRVRGGGGSHAGLIRALRTGLGQSATLIGADTFLP